MKKSLIGVVVMFIFCIGLILVSVDVEASSSKNARLKTLESWTMVKIWGPDDVSDGFSGGGLYVAIMPTS